MLRVEKSRTTAEGGKAWRVKRVRVEACPMGSGETVQVSTLAAFYDQPAASAYATRVVRRFSKGGANADKDNR